MVEVRYWGRYGRGVREWGRGVVFGGICAGLVLGMACGAYGDTVAEKERERAEAEVRRAEAEERIGELERGREDVASQVLGLDRDLTGLMAEMELLEGDMETLEARIVTAEGEYRKARDAQERQYGILKKRIQYVYEEGDVTYLDILLKAESVGNLIVETEYFERLYEYDRELIVGYERIKDEVLRRKTALEEQRAEMGEMKQEYEEGMVRLQTVIRLKRTEVSDFDRKLEVAKREAGELAEVIRKKNEEIGRLRAEEERRREEARRRDEERRREEERLKAGDSLTDSGQSGEMGLPGEADREQDKEQDGQRVVKSSGGTEFGRKVADYGLQFVGNPYVYGGTSLTKGTDCSGFTQSVYRHFGVSIPRTSAEQAHFGTEIPYDEMEPGDLVCYAGHVAMYIGDGKIVHASSAKSGIKVSDNPAYRTIVSIRRPWQTG